MPSAPPSRNDSLPKQALRALVLLATAVVIIAAFWTTGAAILENIRFARATGQILHLIAAAHEFAMTDKNFATQPNEDILSDLTRAGLISGVTDGTPMMLINPWKGIVTSTASAPSAMRIEAHVPARDCRRLALFFVKNGVDLGLSIVEAHAEGEKLWQRFYDREAGMRTPSNQRTEDACEQVPVVTLALVFVLR